MRYGGVLLAIVLGLASGDAKGPSGRLQSALAGAAPPSSAHVLPPLRTGALLVSFLPGAGASARRADLAAVRGTVVRTFLSGAELVAVSPGEELAAARTIQALGHVWSVEPDYLYRADALPDDPLFDLQWGFQNTGQSVTGVPGSMGSDSKVVPAWSISTGTRSIVIAEVDSGVDYKHPDLAQNIWSNPGGIGGCPAGTHGYNVLKSRCDPMDDDVAFGGHGTHVAGILGAVGNNGTGVSGVNWTTTILPVKWLDSKGTGYTSDLLSALDWVLKAKRAGVNIRVVNDSATFPRNAPKTVSGKSQLLSDEIDLLGKNGILFVTAAGNDGDNNDTATLRQYPCGYDRPTEICVTASNESDALPIWANRGRQTVDLAAPGNNIYSTLRNGKYGYVSGGSMASPQVAGAAALILSVRDMSATALKADILTNVDRGTALAGLVRTGGRLNICKAVPGCSESGSVPSGSPGPSASSRSASPAPATDAGQSSPASSTTATPSAGGDRQPDALPPGTLLFAAALVVAGLLGAIVEIRRLRARG
jgi:thermitase